MILFYNELRNTYTDLQIGRVVYKITSLHIYEKDKFMFDYLQEQRPNIETYSHTLTLYQTFSELKKIAPLITTCENLEDIIKLYNFNDSDLDTIRHLNFIFKCRKHKLNR